MNSAQQTWVIAQACQHIAGGPKLPTVEPVSLGVNEAGVPQVEWKARIKQKEATACCPEDALSELLTLLLNSE